VENVIGGAKGDKLVGSDGPNGLDGGDGNDRLEGKGGDDYLDAQRGEGQRLFGGDGTDTCVGYNIIPDAACERG
jgi:Ca2+-binding RTX toxin-like protein